MFTGLIEKLCVINSVSKTQSGYDIFVGADKEFVSTIKKGDSISIDGCCLTCEETEKDSFKVHALKESADKTIIQYYRKSSKVNVERAMRADGRFGGHFVSGHVDCAGRVEHIRKKSHKTDLRISLPGKIGKYLVENDSISVNGISLTIKSVYGNEFTLDIIPETKRATSIDELKISDFVNIEINHITKSIYEFSSRR